MSAALTFCGRSEELHSLVERWQFASDVDEPCPQVVVVKAERGVGKTRLVLEFSRWLSERVDKDGYWPDALTIVDRNLAVNPEPETCKIRERKIPYLWWGMRCTDPARENSIAGDAIATYDQYLAPHLVALLIRENSQRTGKEIALVWAEAVGDAVVTELPELLKHAIPFFGLAVSFGKVVYKTQQIVREGIDRGGTDKALAKPLSRADRALEDLERTFNPKSSAFARTPGIIFIDDAQFASTDATLLGFAERLIHKAVAQRWPLMIIATHWRTEFAEEALNPESFAGIIRHARTGGAQTGDSPTGIAGGYLRDEGYREIDLRVVGDLSAALTGPLRGLTEVQTKAILERVGGNPRFLEQVIAFLLEGNEGLFEDYSVDKALTPEGFAKCLEETQDIFKVVLRRLGRAPQEGQEAICLASIQGMQFSNSIAEEFAPATISRSVREPLLEAENPYSMLTGEGPAEARTIGAFAERLFFDAAQARQKNLKSLRDDAALVGALKNVLRGRLDDNSLNEKLDVDDCALTYRLAVNVFGNSDESVDKARVLLAFAHLVGLEQSRYSFERALDAANRFQALFSTIPGVGELVPAWAIHRCVGLLMSGGHLDEAADLLITLLGFQRELADRLKTPEALSDLAETLNTAGVLARDRTNEAAAAEYCGESLRIRRDLAERLNTPGDLRDLAQILSNFGLLAADRGEDSSAAGFYAESIEIQRGLAECSQTADVQSDLGRTLGNAAILEENRGNPTAAMELYAQALDIQRDLAERVDTLEVVSYLGLTLRNAASLATDQGDHYVAAALYQECLEIDTVLATPPNTPEALRDLAQTVSGVGHLYDKLGRTAVARNAFEQSLSIRRDLAERLNTPQALKDLVASLGDAGIRAEKQGDSAAVADICNEILEIRRDLAERLKTPAALKDLASALCAKVKCCILKGEFAMAMTYWSEGQQIAIKLPADSGVSLVPWFEQLYTEIKQQV